MRPSPSPLEPPLEGLETFGGAKVSDDDQLKKERETPKYRDSQDYHFLNRKHYTSMNTPEGKNRGS